MHYSQEIWLKIMEFFLTLVFMGLAILMFGGIYLIQISLRGDSNDADINVITMDLDFILSISLSFIISCFVYIGK